MIVGKNGKLFGKLNIVDILIIVILIGAVLAGGKALKKSNITTPFTKTEDLQVEFFAEEAADTAAYAVKEGDPVREVIQNANFGRVSKVTVDKSISWAQTSNGEFVASTKTGLASIYIVTDAKGLMGNSGITIDNSVYYIGKTIELYVGNSYFKGKLTAVRKKG